MVPVTLVLHTPSENLTLLLGNVSSSYTNTQIVFIIAAKWYRVGVSLKVH